MSTKRASSALIVDADNNLLVVRRSETHPWAAYQPDLPGGRIKKDETHPDGLAREILEETGIKLSGQDLRKAGLLTHHDFFHINKIEHSLYGFRCKKRPKITLSWEHNKYEWVPLHEVKGLETPIQIEFEKIIASGFFDTL